MSAPVRAHCNVGRPVRVLMMHGDADPIVPLDDQVKQTVATWATRDGCAVGAKPDPYASCRESSEVIFTTVRGGAHEWPPFASSAIGDFFSK